MDKIILASGSPRRKEILENLGFTFKIIPSRIDEEFLIKNSKNEDYIFNIKKIARLKAENIAQGQKDSVVIAADTLVICNGKIMGKPKDLKEARKMLLELSGSNHKVITGICIIKSRTKKTVVDYETTLIKFKELTNEEIEDYLNTGEFLDKAGGYGIQGYGSLFVESIKGCYFNVVGLPVFKLYKNLNRLNINIFKI